VPDWQDWNGRAGAAFDLFGDGRTAVKAFAGRYVANHALGFSAPFNPIATPNVDFRLWTDRNGDGTVINPDGTPQFDEIGPSFNPRFGTAVTANQLDPDTPRGTNWEYSAGIERELLPGWSVSGMWHRRSYGDFFWVDNLNVDASDYQPLTFTAPQDPRLPNGGGEVITIYEFRNPNFQFTTGNLLTTGAPEDWRTWNGFEVIVDGRLWRRGFMKASWTAGKTADHFCQAAQDNPNLLRFCHMESPYRHDAKLSGTVPLPWDTEISGLFQVFAGPPIRAGYRVSAADVGRPIRTAAQDNTVDVNLIQPHTVFDDTSWSLLLRFAKVMTVGALRTRVYMDANNIFNGAAITSRNQQFGGGRVINRDFFRPITIQAGRALSFGLQTTF
jgi:hypothetical protein